MASPLSVFRKYQASLLVVFGVVLMVAFIIAPPLDDYLRSAGRNAADGNPVVVESKYGNLRESDLESMRRARSQAMYFLQQLIEETYRREGTPRGQGIFTSGADSDLVHTYLLAKKAESMGLVVSDQAIVEFLEQLSDGIPPPEIGRIMRQTLGDGTPESYILEQLRVQLLAMRMRAMSQAGLFIPPRQVMTPVHAWQYFKRLHHRVTAEIIPFDVKEIASNLTDEPSEADLQKIYQAGKDRFPDPDRPEPGFKRRRKAAFQYVKYDFSKFLEAEKAKVIDDITDEEIEQHYEQNKQRYEIRSETTPLPELTPEGEAAGEPAPGDPAQPPATSNEQTPTGAPTDDADSDPGSEKSSESSESSAAVSKESSEAGADKPGAANGPSQTDDQPDAPSSSSETPQETPQAGDAPADPSASESDQDPDQSSSLSSKAVFVSVQTPDSESATGQAPPNDAERTRAAGAAGDGRAGDQGAGDQGAESAQPEQPSSTGAANEAAENAPDAETSDNPLRVDEPAAGGDATPADDETGAETETGTDPDSESETEAKEGQQSEADTSAAAGEETAEVEYRPLDDELRAEIREELAQERAQPLAAERISESKEHVRRQLNRFTRNYRKWNIARDSGETGSEFAHLSPEDLELDDLASAGETPVVDALTVRDVDEVLDAETRELGRSVRMPMTFSWPPQQFPFHQEAFAEGVPFYSTGQTGTESAVSFLYWRIKEEPEYVPEFTEVRDEVVAAWKKTQALERAQDQAEQLAEQLAERIGSSNQTFAEFIAANEEAAEAISAEEIIRTNEFSWMSTGFNAAAFGVPGLSHVDGVEKVGPDFMEAVFSLEPGEVGVAVNQPQTFVYLVRIISAATDEELLRDRFLQTGISNEIQYIAEVESLELRRKWFEDLEGEMGVEWRRPPDNEPT